MWNQKKTACGNKKLPITICSQLVYRDRESSWNAASNRAICRPFVWSFIESSSIWLFFIAEREFELSKSLFQREKKKNEFEKRTFLSILNFDQVLFSNKKRNFSGKKLGKWAKRKSHRKNDQLRMRPGREPILCTRYDLLAALLITGYSCLIP